jgi:hypothetical protein
LCNYQGCSWKLLERVKRQKWKRPPAWTALLLIPLAAATSANSNMNIHTSETSVDNHSTRQCNPEDSSEHEHTTLNATILKSCLTLERKLTFQENIKPGLLHDSEQ